MLKSLYDKESNGLTIRLKSTKKFHDRCRVDPAVSFYYDTRDFVVEICVHDFLPRYTHVVEKEKISRAIYNHSTRNKKFSRNMKEIEMKLEELSHNGYPNQ